MSSKNPLRQAAAHNYKKIVKMLLEAKKGCGENALRQAAAHNYLKIVKMLLDSEKIKK